MKFHIPITRSVLLAIILSLLLPGLQGLFLPGPESGPSSETPADFDIIGRVAGEDEYTPDPESTSRGTGSRQGFFENETTIYDLDKNTNIIIEGIEKWDSSGYTLASGDIDGDGYDDMILGAYDAISGPANDRYSAGEVYVIYGDKRSSIPAKLDLAKDTDIVIYGVDENDHMGETLACGDINGDGKDDILIGVPDADGPGNILGQEDIGEVYVIYGRTRSNMPSIIDMSRGADINIVGADTKDFTGSALATGNIDNDLYEDIIISADHADGPKGKRPGVGNVYVFYGKSSYPGTLKVGNADFSIYGNFWGDNFGKSVALGDINSDNFDDILVGAPFAFSGPGRNRTFSGECYVILGNTRNNLGSSLDLENHSNADMVISGADEQDNLGTQVALADLDNDGYDDIIMGALLADGPNNARKNSGDLYIIRGNNSPSAEIDLAVSTNSDLIIYGADPKDKAGESLTLGDMNGDGIQDLVLGASVADGKHNTDPSAGEVYVIFGNITFSPGAERDLGTTGADLIIYSTEADIHAGFHVAAGDIDNDGKDDILIGAPYADIKNGTVQGAGKSYVLYGTRVLMRLKNIGLRLDGVEDRRQPVCYSDYRTYSFVLNVTDTIGVSDIETVKLILDPAGKAIELLWTELTDKFSVNNDPNGYVEIQSTAEHSKKITSTLVELRYNVIFSGDYPDEAFHDVLVISTSGGGLKDTDTYDKIYSVENDIDYRGTLSVESEFQGGLSSGDWIQSGETVRWSGLTVVYEGTDDKFPPNEYFELVIEDDDGDRWTNASSSGQPFSIVTVSDPDTDFSDFHTLWVLCPYTGPHVPNPIQYELKVASPNVTFSSPEPGSDQWFSQLTLNCSITITDGSGGEILGLSIQYAISTSGPFGYGLWKDAGISDNGVSLTPEIVATFDDGDDNYIKWRAKSAIGTFGDIYSGSPGYLIKIDASKVFFSNAFPDEFQWQPRLTVACGIRVNDLWTGVDANSIEYAYSTSGLNSFSNWISTGLIDDKSSIAVEVSLDLVEGIENYIKWRANDVIDNGILESEPFRIKVSTQKPVSVLFLPVNKSELSTTRPTLMWSGFDPNGDEISYDVYLGPDKVEVEGLESGVRVASGHTDNWLETYNLKEDTDYYWTVIPSDGVFTGICESGIWTFRIGQEVQEPEVTLKLPLTRSIINESSVDLIWNAEHYSIIDLEFHVYLDKTPVPLKLYRKVKSSFKLTVDNLEEDVKYYWTVIPVYNNIFGVCRSGIWSFTVNRTYSQFYDISLSVNASHITIPWNRSWEGYLELSNLGNGADEVELSLFASGLEKFINATEGVIMLQAGEVFNTTLNLTIPDGVPARSYNIIFQARSTVSEERETSVLIVDIVGSVKYYRGYEDFDVPDDTRPIIETGIPEEIPRLMRDIIIIALVLVIVVAVTILLVIRHAVNKANERAIQKLKKLIAERKRELEMEGKLKDPSPVIRSSAGPLPVKKDAGEAVTKTGKGIEVETQKTAPPLATPVEPAGSSGHADATEGPDDGRHQQ